LPENEIDGLGRFEKIKARLVANGVQQDRKLNAKVTGEEVVMELERY